MSVLRPLKKLLRVVTGSVESAPGYVVVPYRGYGSRQEIFLMGSVFHQPTGSTNGSGFGRLLAQIARRLLRTGVPDVDVDVRFHGQVERVRTDKDGYFDVHMRLEDPPSSDRLWYEVEVALSESIDPDDVARPSARCEVFIPPRDARFVVISDIDDTVMYTGVANRIKMFWRLFAQNAESRVAFPGVAVLYDAFHKGSSGRERNPILYVSRGHWGLYEMLVEFFRAHDIPTGPILFLREWGVSLKSPLPRRATDHKADLIRTILDLYDEMPFVLVGDSGQHDPEIYAGIVHDHPGRVKAIYIRDVDNSSTRKNEIARLAAEVHRAGASLVLADDSYAMARHAHEHGLISESALGRVLDARVREGEPQPDRRRGPVVIED